MQTDASDFALGAVLYQENDQNIRRPIAFYSRKFQSAEINYPVYDKELLAIVDSLDHWRYLLLGSPGPIRIFSDHKNLVYWSTAHKLNRRQCRWSQALSDYDFVIQHVSGKSNHVADALSRRSDYALSEADPRVLQQFKALLKASQFIYATDGPYIDDADYDNGEVQADLIDQIKNATESDPFVHSLLSSPTPSTHYVVDYGLCFINGRVYVPQTMRKQVLYHFHDHVTAGHPGVRKTFESVSENFYFPELRKFVKHYVEQCEVCQRTKLPRQHPHGLLQPLPIPKINWASVGMDFVVDLPESSGFNAIWTVGCRRSKKFHFIATHKTVTAEQLAQLYIKEVFRLHGLPESFVSDRGSVFTSHFWSELTRLLGIKRDLSTAFHPESDGQTERTNQILEQYLRCYVDYLQDDWVKYLPLAEFAYNSKVQSSLGVSPFEANYGFTPTTLNVPSLDSYVPSVQETVRDLKFLNEYLETELKHAQDRMAFHANKKRKPAPEFSIGQLVWLNRRNIETKRPSSKLDHKRIGPYKVKRQINGNAYELELPNDMRIHPVFHVSLLSPANLDPERVSPKPMPVIIDGNEEFEVEEVLDSRIHRKRLQYRVAWVGYGPEYNTWEPSSNLENASAKVQAFHARYPMKPSPSSL